MSDIEIRPCTSFNMSGERCEHPAGHPGPHIITVEWTDEEAWTPLSTRIAVDLHTEASVYPTPPLAAVLRKDSCLVCDHGPHVGMCPVGECDCRNFVSSIA